MWFAETRNELSSCDVSWRHYFAVVEGMLVQVCGVCEGWVCCGTSSAAGVALPVVPVHGGGWKMQCSLRKATTITRGHG